MHSQESFFGEYLPHENRYDEVFSSDGNVRSNWQPVLDSLKSIGKAELQRRWQHAQQELRVTGVDHQSPESKQVGVWSRKVDFVPHVFSTQEWHAVTRGLCQRAYLLDLLLKDLYGPQQSLQDGLLPAAWLFGHPGFHRAYHGSPPQDGRYLHFYAADLARDRDGQWCVVADRTDAPFGLGFALENRVTVSRMLPALMRVHNIERYAPFFVALDETLRSMAPARRENPRIVLLSRGPGGDNYIEDTYLARYLGYTLVEGGDLAVRNDRVYLKTLAGLLAVDVIYRRQTDEYCDPLCVPETATNGKDALGIPGLLRAVQAGNVAIANALGSSLVESSSLMPFLPELARGLLQEELLLPSQPTWWCGQEEVCRKVVERIVAGWNPRIRAAYRVGRKAAWQPEWQPLDGKEARESYVNYLEENHLHLVAEEEVAPSTAPLGLESRGGPWYLGMRVFLVATNTGYRVLPGGLLRLESEAGALDRARMIGSTTRDVWVAGHEPVPQISLLSNSKHPVVLRRSAADIPSRVADNLFWFGRLIERCQGNCRLLRPLLTRMTGEGEVRDSLPIRFLLRCLAANGQIEPGFVLEDLREKLPDVSAMLPAAIIDLEQPGSISSTILQAVSSASHVRDRLSLDCWKLIYRAEREIEKAKRTLPFGLVELDEFLDSLLVNLVAIDGLVNEGMTRSYVWRFLEMGRRIERALAMCSMVQSLPDHSGTEAELNEDARTLEAMLESADSIMTYRNRYLADFNRAAALDLLITDESNPRALVFQLAEIAKHVSQLPRDEASALGPPESKIAASLLHGVKMLELDDLSSYQTGARKKLSTLLARIVDQLPKLSDLISHRYLIHAGVSRQLASQSRPGDS